MAGQNSNKGNPASKRMSNPRLKARRAECWKRGEARKASRRAAQEVRHQANVEARWAGSLSPHEMLNKANVGPKPTPAETVHAPVHTLESVHDHKGNLTGWVVKRHNGAAVRIMRKSQDYAELRTFIDVLNA